MKRLLSMLLAVMMMLTLMAPAAFADNETTTPGTETGEVVDPEPGETPEPPAEPAAPTIEVTASNNPTSGKVVLTWAAVDGAAKYEVYRSGTKTGEYKLYYTTTKLSYTNTSAYAGYWYHYKVKALDANGAEIVTSDIITQCSDCAAPVITAGNRASNGKVTLKWKAVYGAEKYAIYRATARNGEYVRQYTTTSTSYTNSSAVPGTTYYYKVKAICGKSSYGNSAYSVVKSIKCTPAAPSLSISRVNGKPKLSWKAVSGATKYWIYRSTDGKNFKYYDSTTKTTYTNNSTTVGTRYYYKVKAVVVDNGTSYASAFSSAKSMTVRAAAPTLKTSAPEGTPSLSWNAVNGATKYWVYRSTDGKEFKYYDSTTKTAYTNKSVDAGKTYYYKVKAVNVVNGTSYASDFSNSVSVLVK